MKKQQYEEKYEHEMQYEKERKEGIAGEAGRARSVKEAIGARGRGGRGKARPRETEDKGGADKSRGPGEKGGKISGRESINCKKSRSRIRLKDDSNKIRRRGRVARADKARRR